MINGVWEPVSPRLAFRFAVGVVTATPATLFAAYAPATVVFTVVPPTETAAPEVYVCTEETALSVLPEPSSDAPADSVEPAEPAEPVTPAEPPDDADTVMADANIIVAASVNANTFCTFLLFT